MSDSPIELDYTLAMQAGSAGGISDDTLDSIAPDCERAVDALAKRTESGELGFMRLPENKAALSAVSEYVAALAGDGAADSIADVLLLGIGGSSLGARAVQTALDTAVPTPGRRRLHLPDNSDPWLLAGLLQTLDPRHTLAVVVSKSGGTVETAAQYLVVREWLEQLGPEAARKRLVFVTDPERGPLRKAASQEGIQAFEIPPNVGGRFSVLTAVGLLPASLLGLDAGGLLEGAGRMARACSANELRDNPAALIAAIHVLHQRRHGRNLHVMMPYADALRPFAAWYVQLWAESLGKKLKRDGSPMEPAPTPIAAVGATDQHAQVQLFMEGPRDKLVSFIRVEEAHNDLIIPRQKGTFAYLGGKGLNELLHAEQRATALALAADGRPSLKLTLQRLDAPALGALFILYQAATAIAGELYDIDAFDQPGVEAGKHLAFGLLGRAGHEQAAAEVQRAESELPDRYKTH